jgi:hypothetical protein
MLAVTDVGEPFAGEPHARFDGREVETASGGRKRAAAVPAAIHRCRAHLGLRLYLASRDGPDGLMIWTSAALPGHTHDLSCAQRLAVTAALNWAAAELNLPALADAGYEGAGHGIKTPTKQPARRRGS